MANEKQDYANKIWKPLIIGGIIVFILIKMK